jgi:hypothetical protein
VLQWIDNFNQAAQRVLAQQRSPVLRLEAEPCPDHGANCVRIRGGDIILNHSRWVGIDPAQLAEALLIPLLAKIDKTPG